MLINWVVWELEDRALYVWGKQRFKDNSKDQSEWKNSSYNNQNKIIRRRKFYFYAKLLDVKWTPFPTCVNPDALNNSCGDLVP